MNRTRRITLTIFTTLMLGAVTLACESKEADQQAQPSNSEYPLEISLEQFASAIQKNPQSQVLDVRTPMEYQEVHVASAQLLPLQDIMALGKEEIVKKIPFAKDSEFFVICRSGNRSFTAVRYLRAMGYEKAVSVRGGTAGYQASGVACNSATLACAR